MRLRVIQLPAQGDAMELTRPYLLVFDKAGDCLSQESRELLNGLKHKPEACHAVLVFAEELDVE